MHCLTRWPHGHLFSLPLKPSLLHIHLSTLTSGSDSRVLGGGVSLGGFFSSLGPTLGGGRWKSLDWSCCALGQGRVPLTHSTGSSHTAFWPWTWKTFRENEITLNEQLFLSTNFTLWGEVFTLMPSLAPSCRYGMIEWFHRSMNHGLNSATDTGHDKKKQGPNGDKNATLRKNSPPRTGYILVPPWFSPMRKSEVLYFSRKVWRWYQSWGTQSSKRRRAWRCAESRSFPWWASTALRWRYLSRNPLAGSTLLENVNILS